MQDEIETLNRQLQEKELQEGLEIQSLKQQWKLCSVGSRPNPTPYTSGISGCNFKSTLWHREVSLNSKTPNNSWLYVTTVR